MNIHGEIMNCAYKYRNFLLQEKGGKGLLKFSKNPINLKHRTWEDYRTMYRTQINPDITDSELNEITKELLKEAVEVKVSKDMKIPENLTEKGVLIAQKLKSLLVKYGFWWSGGCTIFKSVQYYRRNTPEYTAENNFGFDDELKCELILQYEGADAVYMFDPYLYINDYYFFNIFEKEMEKLDVFWETYDGVTIYCFTRLVK